MLTIDDALPIQELSNQYMRKIAFPSIEQCWAIAFASELTSELFVRNLEYNLGHPKPDVRLWAGYHLMRFHDLERRHRLREGGAGLN